MKWHIAWVVMGSAVNHLVALLFTPGEDLFLTNDISFGKNDPWPEYLKLEFIFFSIDDSQIRVKLCYQLGKPSPCHLFIHFSFGLTDNFQSIIFSLHIALLYPGVNLTDKDCFSRFMLTQSLK